MAFDVDLYKIDMSPIELADPIIFKSDRADRFLDIETDIEMVELALGQAA